MELFSSESCPFAQRTRMVLIEKNVDFTLTEIDLQNKPDWWLEISPYGKVPLLRHDGGVIYESAIINEYIDEVCPDPPLMPEGALARARVRIWIDYCDRRFLPACYRLRANGEQPDLQRENLDKLTEVLRFMEHEGLRKLGPGPYWLGARPSLVDFHYLPFFERFPVYEQTRGAEWPADCARLREWFDTMRKRKSFQATAHPLEYHLERYRQRIATMAKST
jgi:glutathione S-transferase